MPVRLGVVVAAFFVFAFELEAVFAAAISILVPPKTALQREAANDAIEASQLHRFLKP